MRIKKINTIRERGIHFEIHETIPARYVKIKDSNEENCICNSNIKGVHLKMNYGNINGLN